MMYFLWGTVGLLAGFVLLVWGTSGWKPWQNPFSSEEKKRATLLAGVIGLSGLFTTLGWNQFSAHQQEQTDKGFRQALEKANREFREKLDERDQGFRAAQERRDAQLRKARKNATILGVAREWKMNDLARNRKPLPYVEVGDWDKIVANQAVLPRFLNSQARTAVTSDLFDYSDPNDARFTTCAIEYALRIDETNLVFDMADPIRWNVQLARGFFSDRGAYAAFLRRHNMMGGLLERQYPWVMEDIQKLRWNSSTNVFNDNAQPSLTDANSE